MPRLAVLAVTTLILLAGCTSDGEGDGDKDSAKKPSASKTTAKPTGPDCAGIWKDGATLPASYTTCVADGVLGPQDVTECQDGSTLVAYSDTFFAVTGGEISKPEVAPMQDTKEFGEAYTACTGE